MNVRFADRQMYGLVGVARARAFHPCATPVPASWSIPSFLVGTDHKSERPRRLQDSS